jgi:hypothetical protein
MKRISLTDLAKFPDAWKMLCPKVDITNPPNGFVHISEILLPTFFKDGNLPPMENWNPANQPAQPPPTAPLPRDQWPAWASALALLAKPGDKGLGDVIARTVGPIGGDAYKAWFVKLFNRSCGCQERQEQLNAQYPL